ncbi:unnamed protein product [Cercospora beticola]|nr:unnamed protein product [Cercospora beticola]
MHFQTSLLLFAILSTTSAYQIDMSCFWNGGFDVHAGVDEAKAIAEYAAFRMADNDPALGEIVKQTMGNNREDRRKFRENMNTVDAGFGPFTGPWISGLLNDPTVVIKCNANHFQRAPGQFGTWIDPEFPNMPHMVPNSLFCQPTPNGMQTVAFTYETGLVRQPSPQNAAVGPSHVIVICAGPTDAARNKVTGIGTTWRTRDWTGVEFLDFDRYLSYSLLHEIMHVANPGLGHTLASGRGEAYGWHDINALNNADKQSNADSYCMLATALWMKRHTISGTGGKFGRRHPVSNRPKDSPNDRHP